MASLGLRKHTHLPSDILKYALIRSNIINHNRITFAQSTIFMNIHRSSSSLLHPLCAILFPYPPDHNAGHPPRFLSKIPFFLVDVSFEYGLISFQELYALLNFHVLHNMTFFLAIKIQAPLILVTPTPRGTRGTGITPNDVPQCGLTVQWGSLKDYILGNPMLPEIHVRTLHILGTCSTTGTVSPEVFAFPLIQDLSETDSPVPGLFYYINRYTAFFLYCHICKYLEIY